MRKLLFVLSVLSSGCVGALQGGTIGGGGSRVNPYPPVVYDVVVCASAPIDGQCTQPIAGASVLGHGGDGYSAPKTTDANGYVLFTFGGPLPDSDVIVRAEGFVEARQHIDTVACGAGCHNFVVMSRDHVDPGMYTKEQLLKFRGALFTVKANHLDGSGFCDLPDGPRPHQPDNIAVFASYYYTKEQRQCVYQLWKERGYTHGPVGPFVDPGYHGQTPGIDFRQDNGEAAADVIQEVWDAGLIPVVFLTPDGWTVEQLRALDPIFKSPRWQKLLRVVVNGYEQQGTKYGWSNAQYVQYLSWEAETFPNAVRGLHTISDIEAPVGNGDDTSKPGMSNGECWARVVKYIHFWLHQSNALFTPDHVADNGKTDGENWLALWDRNNPYSFVTRFTKGTAGWPTVAADGNPLCVVPGEYRSYITWWQNAPEEVAREWGRHALELGACGFMDGGREP